MLAFFGNRQGGFAIVGFGVNVRAVHQESFHDFEMSVGRGREQRRVPGAIPVIAICS
jgi:hypothetical protein